MRSIDAASASNGARFAAGTLLILSAVVGLDVSSFRVTHVISPCASGTPSTVTIQPAPVGMATGDVFTLAATVRDAGGVLLGGRNLAWASNAPGVVTVDSTGTSG